MNIFRWERINWNSYAFKMRLANFLRIFRAIGCLFQSKNWRKLLQSSSRTPKYRRCDRSSVFEESKRDYTLISELVTRSNCQRKSGHERGEIVSQKVSLSLLSVSSRIFGKRGACHDTRRTSLSSPARGELPVEGTDSRAGCENSSRRIKERRMDAGILESGFAGFDSLKYSLGAKVRVSISPRSPSAPAPLSLFMTSSNLASRAHFLLLVVVLVVYSPSSSKFLAKVRPILLFQLLAKLKAVRWNLNIECRGCVSVAVREISLGICGEIFIKGNCLFGLFEWFYSATFYAYGTFLVEFQLSVLCMMRSWSI